ncbi:MAG: hypothetical protein NZ519_11935 [Bacteroidia bacterium]|nr:hypothetical protein [Bacteroidia bacterium]
MRRACVSTVRSEAQHRSDSVARSTPTLPIQAQRSMGKGTPKKLQTFQNQLFLFISVKTVVILWLTCIFATCL